MFSWGICWDEKTTTLPGITGSKEKETEIFIYIRRRGEESLMIWKIFIY